MSLFEPDPPRDPVGGLLAWQTQWGDLGRCPDAELSDEALSALLMAMTTEVQATYGLDAQPMLHKVITAMLLDEGALVPLRWAIPLADRVFQVDLAVGPDAEAGGEPGGGLELVVDNAFSELDDDPDADLARWPVAAVRDALATVQARWPTTDAYERWLPLVLGALAWQRLRAEQAHQRVQVLDGIPWEGQTHTSTLTVREAPRKEAIVLTSTRWGQRA